MTDPVNTHATNEARERDAPHPPRKRGWYKMVYINAEEYGILRKWLEGTKVIRDTDVKDILKRRL